MLEQLADGGAGDIERLCRLRKGTSVGDSQENPHGKKLIHVALHGDGLIGPDDECLLH
jgi:hypothetical protein